MTVKNNPLAEVSQRTMEVLCRELGAADTVRFLNQFTTGHGDYTSDRDTLFAGETLDQIVAGIRRAEDSPSAGGEHKPSASSNGGACD
jgi:hypothetical protein